MGQLRDSPGTARGVLPSPRSWRLPEEAGSRGEMQSKPKEVIIHLLKSSWVCPWDAPSIRVRRGWLKIKHPAWRFQAVFSAITE